MEKFKALFEKLSLEDQKTIALIMISKKIGIITDGSGNSCTGCTPTTTYGGCYIIDGNCTWIPEIG